MRVQEHIKLSTAAAVVASPWLKQDVWIPLLASIGIDVDHFIWHAITYRTLSLRAAVRFFGQADPPQPARAKFLHQPAVLGSLFFIALLLRSRLLFLILVGMSFHVSLDVLHISLMDRLKKSLSRQAQYRCAECGKAEPALQLHTLHFAKNLLDRYAPRNFVVLCPDCHEKAHLATKSPVQAL
jgi:5-methylcytosine-specific restriction endonuclease McrA